MKEIEKKDDLDLFLPTGYVAPKESQVVVDNATGKIEDVKTLPPLKQMKLAAERFNIPINDAPKKNCKKCYERGYIGFNPDKSPVACNCMFPAKTSEQKKQMKDNVPLSFLPKKAQRKFWRDKQKQLRKEMNKASTKRELQKIKEGLIAEAVRKAQELSGTSITSGADAFAPANTENCGVLPSKESEEVNGEVA